MLEASRNPVPHLCQHQEAQNIPRTESLADEPAICVPEVASKPDPLLINEPKESKDRLLVVKHSVAAVGPLENCAKMRPKKPKLLKTLVSKESLKAMVYASLGRTRNKRGYRPQDIKSSILSMYDVSVDSEQVVDAMREGLASGEISQIKRRGAPIRRFRLSKPNMPGSKRGTKKTEDPGSSTGSMSFDGSKKRNFITDVKTMQRSKFNDYDVQNGGQFIDADDVKMEETSEGESNPLPGVGKRVNEFGLKRSARKRDGDPIYTSGIDFMVLHSMYSSQNPDGIRMDEIAEFIRSFYGVDVPKLLPLIEKYLNYSVERGVLIRNGDRYKKTVATWKMNTDGKIPLPELVKNGSTCHNNKSFFTGVKLEAEETENFLTTDKERVEINVDNNVVRSIDKKPEPKIVKTFKIKRENFISGKHVPHLLTVRKEPARNSSRCSKTQPGTARLQDMKNLRVSLVRYVDTKKPIKAETLEPSVSSKSGKVIPVTSENMESSPSQPKYKGIFPVIRAAFETPTYDKHNLSVFNIEERETLQIRKAHGHNNIKLRRSAVKYRRTIGIKHGLDVIMEYLFHHPLPLKNLALSTWNLSWKKIALARDTFCLKLTGNSTPSSEALHCKVCGSQLTFGPSKCPACFFELENLIEKCEICDLLCNRGDVFHKHFLWEHSPSLQGEDDDSFSVAEMNIFKSLKKLADGDLYLCRLCMYLSDNIEMFEVHIATTHTTMMNVFPPFPEVDEPEKVAIFLDEISNTRCYKCKECGFVSNRRNFAVYHMLDVHIVGENENYGEFLWNLETEDLKRRQEARINRNFGLCDYCGRFYNDVRSHMDTHDRNRSKTLQNIVRGQPTLVADVELQKYRERQKARKRARIKKANNILCHICGKRMYRRLQQHLRTHSSEMYPCHICGKEFNRRSNLFTHKRVHTREKPFQCDICKMRFGYKCSIKGHVINVHSETVR